MDFETFAKRLKQARQAKGLTQRQLAEKAGTTQNTISTYEKNGQKQFPSVTMAAKLADALEVSIDWLCGRTDNQESTTKPPPKDMTEFFACSLLFLLDSGLLEVIHEENGLLGEYHSEWYSICASNERPEEKKLFDKFCGNYIENKNACQAIIKQLGPMSEQATTCFRAFEEKNAEAFCKFLECAGFQCLQDGDETIIKMIPARREGDNPVDVPVSTV